MEKLRFDTPIDRYHTDSVKFDFKKKYGKEEGVLPLWVADTDFAIPKEAADAIRKRAEHPLYGYSAGDASYYDSLREWMKTRHGYEIQNDWVINTPSVVFAMVIAIRKFTKEGEAVMIQTPVYGQFYKTVVNNHRELVEVPLLQDKAKENGYEMDFAKIEQLIVERNVKAFLLCNPHNPVGRVWTKQELTRLGDILIRHDVRIISDEIHMDLAYPGYKHIVFASLKEEFAKNTITCTAPTKVFNIAGLQQANIIISEKELRNQFRQEVHSTGYMEPNIFGMIASRECYAHGAEYVDELIRYVSKNVSYVTEFVKENMPKARVIKPEGMYLLWIDFSGYGYEKDELVRRIEHVAKLWLNDGEAFGVEGRGYMRINLATTLATVKEACERMLLI